MHIDQLTDKSGFLISLINCNVSVESKKIFCGLAYFRGGMSGQIPVYAGDRKFLITIPDSVKSTATSLIIAHPEDKIEISYVSS